MLGWVWRYSVKQDARPQINASKMVFGGGIAAVIFTVGSMLIFLAGLPVLRYMFPAAIVLGLAVALILRFSRHRSPGAPWLLPATENETGFPHKPEGTKNPERSSRMVAVAIPAHS
jgi:hypothetical protein